MVLPPDRKYWRKGTRAVLLEHTAGLRFASWLSVYVVVTYLTCAVFFGDTRGYASSILQFIRGEDHPFWVDNSFWDFGHLLWRPTGWLVYRAIEPLISRVRGTDLRTNVTVCLFGICWVTGLFCVLLLNRILRSICDQEWPATLATFAFLFSQAFLNFSQTGCSYVPGLSLLLVGLALLVPAVSRDTKEWPMALAAGAALAGAICFWFLYVLALPAALLVSLLLFGTTKRRVYFTLLTGVFAGLFVAISYSLVIVHLRLYSLRELVLWVSTSSHGADRVRGFARLVFGLARSMINMGNDGRLFKRFLLKDSYNPVSPTQLGLFSLSKLLLFYSMCACTLVVLWQSRSRTLVLSLLASSLPVTAFGYLWQGGDMERYLPLFPFLFIALAYSLSNDSPLRWFRQLILMFVIVLVVTNSRALLRSRSNDLEQYEAERVARLQPLLKPGSWIVVFDDEFSHLKSNPLHTTSQNDALPTYVFMTPGSSKILHWHQDLATLAFRTWQEGADIWLSKRARLSRPLADSSWVEGDDRRISWLDIYSFCSQLETGTAVGGMDGFELVLPSPKNRALLRSSILAADESR